MIVGIFKLLFCVKIMTSVLVGLLIREFDLYHFSAFAITCSSLALTVSIFFPRTMNWESSAYESTLASGKELASSLVKQRNSMGPRMDPWGTPLVTVLSSDVTFLNLVFCFRYWR